MITRTVADIRARMEAHGARYAPPITFVEMLDSLAPHVLESRLVLNDEATIRTMNTYRQKVAMLRHTIRRLECGLITSQAHTVLQMERAETAEQEAARLDSQVYDLAHALHAQDQELERVQDIAWLEREFAIELDTECERRMRDWYKVHSSLAEMTDIATALREQLAKEVDSKNLLRKWLVSTQVELDRVQAIAWPRVIVPEPPVRVPLTHREQMVTRYQAALRAEREAVGADAIAVARLELVEARRALQEAMKGI